MNRMEKRKIKHLVVITGNYPSPAQQTNGTFVRQFVRAVARQGVKCTVIQPVAFHDATRQSGFPFHSRDEVGKNTIVDVFMPRFLSVSAREGYSHLGPLNPSRFTLKCFISSIRRVVDRYLLEPDALYGHFLYLAGAAAVRIGREMQIPSYAGIGESSLWSVQKFGLLNAKRDLASAAGFLANSTLLKEIVSRELSIRPDKIGVFPNGTDLSRFKPQNKEVSRKKFGLPPDKFLVCSVGHFDTRKGIARVGEAIKNLTGVVGAFAGSGPIPPKTSNTIFSRPVLHDEMPAFLSACDVFVLPTLAEGSCNAIIEAMACGLPVVSSVGSFNDDILMVDMSIRIDPLDVNAIRDAIIHLRDNPELRSQMSEAAFRHAQHFDVNERARRMLSFMEKRLHPESVLVT